MRESLLEQLDAVPSLDEDRICRAFLTLIDATVRTNAFRGRDEIAVKLRPSEIAFLPGATPAVRDLRVLAVRRGRPPAWRPDRPRRTALERTARGLPHRGARSDEGADGEERRDRPDRREGWLRRQGFDRRSRRSRGGACRRHRPLPAVRTQPARRHRQRRGRRGRAPARTPSCSTATTRTSSWPPTRAPRRSATSPTRSPPSTTSGSVTRSPPAGATATTTRRWASPPGVRGRAFGATPGCSA